MFILFNVRCDETCQCNIVNNTISFIVNDKAYSITYQEIIDHLITSKHIIAKNSTELQNLIENQRFQNTYAKRKNTVNIVLYIIDDNLNFIFDQNTKKNITFDFQAIKEWLTQFLKSLNLNNQNIEYYANDSNTKISFKLPISQSDKLFNIITLKGKKIENLETPKEQIVMLIEFEISGNPLRSRFSDIILSKTNTNEPQIAPF